MFSQSYSTNTLYIWCSQLQIRAELEHENVQGSGTSEPGLKNIAPFKEPLCPVDGGIVMLKETTPIRIEVFFSYDKCDQ